MHFIDTQFGKPLCFFFSCVKKIRNIFFTKQQILTAQNKPIKILFIELPEMGSAFMCYTSLKKIIDNTANNIELFFLIFEKNAESIRILNLLKPENIITIRSDNFINFCIDTIKTIFYFRKQKIDIIIDLEIFSRFSVIYSFLIGAKEIIGFYMQNIEGLYRGDILTKKINYNYYQHISKNYLALTEAALEIISKNSNFNNLTETSYSHIDKILLKQPITTDILIPKINKDSKIIEQLKIKIKSIYPDFEAQKFKIFVISPDGGEIPIRAWAADNYIKLSQKLINTFNNLIVIITGGKSSIKYNNEIYNKIQSNRCLNLTDKTSLIEFIQLLHLANVFLTNDGGAAHFASATNTPAFIFFGPETPIMYKPLGDNIKILYADFICSPCISAFNYRISACKDNRCINFFTVDYIANLISDYIK